MQTDLKHKNLLIVDDEPDIGEILQWELGSLGANCIVANGAAQALKLFNDLPLDGIITDIRMPQQSGTDLLKTVRERKPQIPVLLMTGFADLSLPRAHDLGAEALVSKPFELDELCRSITFYTQPLATRWKVEVLKSTVDIPESLLDFGRGGFLVRSAMATMPRPKVGSELCVRLLPSKQVFRVVCRWHYGDAWAAEILSWDDATKKMTWAHGNDISFIPLKQWK